MKELETKIKEFLQARRWDRLRPGDLAKSVAIEAGELLELFQWENPSLEDVQKDPERIAKIKKELADVLMYCLDISVLLDFNTEEIVREKLAHIEKKYPAELMRKSAGGEAGSGADAEYWRIKNQYRRDGK